MRVRRYANRRSDSYMRPPRYTGRRFVRDADETETPVREYDVDDSPEGRAKDKALEEAMRSPFQEADTTVEIVLDTLEEAFLRIQEEGAGMLEAREKEKDNLKKRAYNRRDQIAKDLIKLLDALEKVLKKYGRW